MPTTPLTLADKQEAALCAQQIWWFTRQIRALVRARYGEHDVPIFTVADLVNTQTRRLWFALEGMVDEKRAAQLKHEEALAPPAGARRLKTDPEHESLSKISLDEHREIATIFEEKIGELTELTERFGKRLHKTANETGLLNQAVTSLTKLHVVLASQMMSDHRDSAPADVLSGIYDTSAEVSASPST